MPEFSMDQLRECYERFQNSPFGEGSRYARSIVNSVPDIFKKHEQLLKQRKWLADRLAEISPTKMTAEDYIKSAENAVLWGADCASEVDALKARIAELTKQRDEYAKKLAKARGYAYVGEMHLDDFYDECVAEASKK